MRTDGDRADALTDLLAEIAEMRDTPVPADEFADAKRAHRRRASRCRSRARAQILNYYIQSWTYGLPADYWDTYPARIAAVTAEQAQAAAKKYWDPARLQIVAVGDAPQDHRDPRRSTERSRCLRRRGQAACKTGASQ